MITLTGFAAETTVLAQRPDSDDRTEADAKEAEENSTASLEVDPAVLKLEQSRINAIETASRATVCVFGPKSQGGGSGVVISPDGFALSNYHVVEGCGAFMKCSMNDGVLYDAVIVGIDPVGDVALIKLLGRDDFPSAVMANSDDVRAGDWCFAVGNPFLLATDYQPSVSWGIVSGVQRYQYPSGTLLEYADCIQTDAAINPGNSGGALFNGAGELIGINGRGGFEKRGRVNVGVGYAISINQIKYFLDCLKSGRLIDHATLGATVSEDDQGDVRVSNIIESSDAYRRGLRYDDQILAFGGREISTVNQFKNVLGIYPKGYRVPITFRREDEERTALVRLTGVHATEQLVEMIEGVVEQEKKSPDEDEDELPKPPTPPAEPPDDEAEELSPEEFRHMYVERRGFTNFYFNRLYRDQIWETNQRKWGDFTTQTPRWRITGTNRSGETVTILLSDDQSGIQIGDNPVVLDPDSDLSSQLVPEGTGGLLVALHLWRKMLLLGPSQFGDVVYFGSVPLNLDRDPKQVLVATRGVIESHLFFDRRSARLDALEMYPDIGTDPCRLMFQDYQQDEDLSVPGTIAFSYGDSSSDEISVTKFEFLKEKK
jgi:S1-C subfamily serine protease